MGVSVVVSSGATLEALEILAALTDGALKMNIENAENAASASARIMSGAPRVARGRRRFQSRRELLVK
jgi:hypothetical protein